MPKPSLTIEVSFWETIERDGHLGGFDNGKNPVIKLIIKAKGPKNLHQEILIKRIKSFSNVYF